MVLATLALGSSAIHVAAGSAHAEALGDIGLALYGAAMFQAAIAIGFLRARASGPGRALSWTALAGSVAVTSAWVVSRTVGLPLVPGGVEPIGTADLIATLMQTATIALLIARMRRPAPATPFVVDRGSSRLRRGATTGGLVAIVAVIALTSSIAVVDVAAVHGHGTAGHSDTPSHGDASGHGDDLGPTTEHGSAVPDTIRAATFPPAPVSDTPDAHDPSDVGRHADEPTNGPSDDHTEVSTGDGHGDEPEHGHEAP